MASLTDIKTFFEGYDYKINEVKINQCTIVKDVKKFAEVNINILENNWGKKKFIPYYSRLLFVYNYLINNKNEKL